MYRSRVIPCLLLQDEGLVKTVGFAKPTYIGDPLNAIRIYNQKEVDELIFLDIDATKNKREPNYDYLRKIADQCFMPLCYGGGITTLEQIQKIFALGFEKVSLNAAAYYNPDLIKEAAGRFGSQSIVAAMDVAVDKKGTPEVRLVNGRIRTGKDPAEYAGYLEELGAGELLINDITRDGTMTGYNEALIREIAERVSIPVIACGGAGKLEDCAGVIRAGASAAAAGSLFVYWGRLRGILINYPDEQELNRVLNTGTV
jgi:cyclase